jgi:hypothetical protein
VHLADHVWHPGHVLGACADHDVDSVAEDVELPVGDEGGHLDEEVGADVEPGHLAVDPHQPEAQWW